jgi:hypothetical protein
MRKNWIRGFAIMIMALLLLNVGCVSALGRPRPTPSPTRPASLSWDGSIGALLNDRCAACHGQVAGLSYAIYYSALRGGMHGPSSLPAIPITAS